jgi:hypothetical protein
MTRDQKESTMSDLPTFDKFLDMARDFPSAIRPGMGPEDDFGPLLLVAAERSPVDHPGEDKFALIRGDQQLASEWKDESCIIPILVDGFRGDHDKERFVIELAPLLCQPMQARYAAYLITAWTLRVDEDDTRPRPPQGKLHLDPRRAESVVLIAIDRDTGRMRQEMAQITRSANRPPVVAEWDDVLDVLLGSPGGPHPEGLFVDSLKMIVGWVQ